ncbi:uncharacterized protein [Fopius arisanus]|uniref:Uncharacterized protein n=1 Tax=Fopius arisanus TaxID=64838 RepID=A0A9R1T102_9HYME|nr:PREDICTED: uncharacterized protein LOC105265105 [Fopius arisanus]
MFFETTNSNTNQMSDEELDEAVTSHLKKLDTLEIMEKLLGQVKNLNLPESSPSNEPVFSESVTSGDWADASNSRHINSRIFTREMLNLSSIFTIPEGKSKNVYRISNPVPLQTTKFSIPLNEKNPGPENEEKKHNFLISMRNFLVNYQESQGISRDEYCFTSLLKILGQATGKSLLTLFFMLVNIAPMTKIILFISRFILDKTVDIVFLQDTKQKATRSAIFGLQLISIYICLLFIFGFIWLPFLQMIFGIISQILFFQ